MPDSGQYGAFIPTTSILDVVQEVQSTNVNTPEFKELIIRLYEYLNKMALLLNQKDTGLYDDLDAFVCGQIYFPSSSLSNANDSNTMRQVYRKVIDFGALPNAGTTSVAHRLELNNAATFTRIYGCATNPGTSFIPLPYASSTLNQNIILNVDMTNVNITTAIDYSAYTTTYVVLEFITN